MIGFSFMEALHTLRYIKNLDAEQICIMDMNLFDDSMPGGDVIGKYVENHRGMFNLVVINQKALRFDFKSMQQSVLSVLRSLGSRPGVLIINEMRPTHYDISGEYDDAWKMLADVRQHDFFDAALANFDGGLLVCSLRKNPYVISASFFLDRDEKFLMSFLDRVIPVLSFPEVHAWLGNASSTTKYVRTFKRN